MPTPAKESRNQQGPLQGVRVLECASDACPLALRLAISFAARMAAGLGAQVTKLGRPERDPVRFIGPFIGSSSALSAFLDAGKYAESGQADEDMLTTLRRARTAPDIVFCDDLAFVHLGVAFASSVRTVFSMFPHGSTCTSPPASEFTVMAAGGLLDLVGDPDRAPLRMGGHQLAYSCALAAYGGAVAALCAQRAGQGSEVVRVSMADVAVWLNWKSVAMCSWSTAGRARLGRDAEWQVLRCADGWVALVFLEADWPVLRDFVDDPRLREPRFNDRAERRRHARLVAETIENTFRRHTRRELADMALRRRLPLGPVWTPAELEADPQNLARNFFSRVRTEATGTPLLMPRLPILWNGQALPSGTAKGMPR